jgi:lipid-binding SYLF domain-containing protein
MTMSRALAVITLMLAVLLTAPSPGKAATAAGINDAVNATLHSFDAQNPSARELARKAAGILVFPSVYKAGFGIGGSYGEGVLIVGGNPAGYYNIAGASFGFQLGVQAQTLIIMFMTEQSLASFRSAYGFRLGLDGSIVVAKIGAGATVDTNTLTGPIIAFVLDPAGLMYSLSLEGSKITKIER